MQNNLTIILIVFFFLIALSFVNVNKHKKHLKKIQPKKYTTSQRTTVQTNKDTTSQPTTVQTNKDTTTKPEKTPIIQKKPKFIKYKGGVIWSDWGFDLPNMPQRGFRNCMKNCENNKKCSAFTFDELTKKCWLKKKGWSGKNVEIGTRYDLYVKKNQTNKNTKQHSKRSRKFNKYKGDVVWSDWGFDLPNMPQRGFRKCMKKCENNKKCSSFTFDERTKKCWLKRKGWTIKNVEGGTRYDLYVKKNYIY